MEAWRQQCWEWITFMLPIFSQIRLYYTCYLVPLIRTDTQGYLSLLALQRQICVLITWPHASIQALRSSKWEKEKSFIFLGVSFIHTALAKTTVTLLIWHQSPCAQDFSCRVVACLTRPFPSLCISRFLLEARNVVGWLKWFTGIQGHVCRLVCLVDPVVSCFESRRWEIAQAVFCAWVFHMLFCLKCRTRLAG